MTIKEFIGDYKGFNWNEGEFVVTDQRTGKCKILNLNKLAKEEELGSPSTLKMLQKDIYRWDHTEKTMLIVL